MNPETGLRANLWTSSLSMLTSTSTLVCCTLPAVLVAVGAGATLAGLISHVPQLIWLSAHKVEVFGAAGAMLLAAGMLQWHARGLPCPADPATAAACKRSRRWAAAIYLASVLIFCVGVIFAFVLPLAA